MREMDLDVPVNDGRRLEVVVDFRFSIGGGHHICFSLALRRDGHAMLVVEASEIAGRWSEEAASFFRQLAKARATCEPPVLIKRAEQTCGGSPYSRVQQHGRSQDLLMDRKLALGVDGVSPSVHDVVGEARFAGLS